MDKTVLVIGKFCAEAFALHIAETFESMGYRTLRWEPGIKYPAESPVFLKRCFQVRNALYELSRQFHLVQDYEMECLKGKIRGENIDLTILCHDFLLPRQIKLLKTLTQSPIVLWFPDSIALFQKAFFLNAEYDFLFFKDPYIVHILHRGLKRRIYYLPECCNPLKHSYAELSQQDLEFYGCDLTTAGNWYPYRAAFFEQLSSYQVKIWGNPPPLWMNVGNLKKLLQNRYLTYEQKSKAFRAAKIVVNNLNPAEIWGVNVRTFEIAAAGAFQLVDWRPGISQLFDEENEIITFTNRQDLTTKIDYYLPREDERRRIALAGMKRVLKDHTYEKRLQLLMETVFNGGSGYPMPVITVK